MGAAQDPVDRVTHWTAAGVGILNGIFGDYLVRRSNGLAIAMAFRHSGQALALEPSALQAAYPACDGRICIFLHGLCCTEASWQFSAEGNGTGQTYGSLLHDEIGITPMFVRYNTGLPIAENGRRLAGMLDALLAAFPVTIREIVLVGHSMGGLVARSACTAARSAAASGGPGGAWLPLLGKAFYLGTPHEGADLEKFAQATGTVLDAMPGRVSRLIGDILDLRSEGIKDLRTGLGAVDTVADIGSRDDADSIRHYLVAGTLADDPQHPVSRLLGDGLVRMPDTTDVAEGAQSGAKSDAQRVQIAIFPGVHHMALAHDMGVYRQIRDWMTDKVDK